MDGAMKVEIHFHQKDKASVFLESNATGDDQRRNELLFFSCFAARQLVNVADDMQLASSLAKALSMFELPLAPLDDDFKPFIGFVLTTAPNGAKLVDYRGIPGRKLFEAEIRIVPPSSFSFTLQNKGFGSLLRGINYYAKDSVLLLLKYLARRRIEDGDYLYNLSKVAEFCGKIYLKGKLTPKDHLSEAVKIIRMAELETQRFGPSWVTHPLGVLASGDRIGYLSLVGVPSAQYQVAMMYYQGEVRPQDYKAAADHFRKAAGKGFSPAKYMIGCMYLEGNGVELSYAESFKWITEAAEEGYAPAQVVLGQMYDEGAGVSRNLKEAAKWYGMAAKQGNEAAKKKLLEIGSLI